MCPHEELYLMFRAALFQKPQNSNLSINRRTYKLQYFHTMKYDSAKGSNELLKHATWKNFTIIILNDRNWTKIVILYDSIYVKF